MTFVFHPFLARFSRWDSSINLVNPALLHETLSKYPSMILRGASHDNVSAE